MSRFTKRHSRSKSRHNSESGSSASYVPPPGRLAEQIEISGTRHQCEVQPACHGLDVQLERQPWRGSAKVGLQRGEGAGEASMLSRVLRYTTSRSTVTCAEP